MIRFFLSSLLRFLGTLFVEISTNVEGIFEIRLCNQCAGFGSIGYHVFDFSLSVSY